MDRKKVALGCGGVGLFGGLAGALGLLVVVVVALLVVVPWLASSRIEKLVVSQLEQQVDADVALGQLDVSLLSSFPRLRVRVRDVKLVGREPFAGVPLADIGELRVEVDPLSALSGSTLTVRSVALVDPRFEVVVLKDGRTNTDLTKGGSAPEAPAATPDAADSTGGAGGSGYQLKLDEVELINLSVVYDDRQSKLKAEVSDLDFVVRAKLSEAVSTVDLDGTIAALTVRMGRTTWLRDTKWKIDALLDYDSQTGGITFRENQTTVNALPVVLTGSAVPSGPDWNLDLAFEAKEATFASILSLVPNAYRGSMEGVDASGTLSLAGTTKGRYGGEEDVWPGFDLTLAVRDARFKYPDLPTAVEDIALDLKATHAEGPSDTMKVDVGRFAFALAGQEPFVASARVTHPLTDPVVDAKARGHLDLGKLRAALPLPEGTEPPSGQIDVDVAFAGAQSDFMAPNPDKIQASGRVDARNVTYRSDDLPVEVVVDALKLSLAADSAQIEALQAHYGDSDLSATGRFDNLVGYALGGETLAGSLSLTSSKLDLRPFQGSGGGGSAKKEAKSKKGGKAKAEPEPTDDEGGDDEGLLVAVPTNLAIAVDADLKKVITKRVAVDAVRGRMRVQDGAVRMEDVKASLLGGSATVSGAYVAPTVEEADVDLALSAVKFDVGQTLAAVTTIKKIAPILEGTVGSYDSGFSVKAKLARDGTPDLELLTSAGSLGASGLKLKSKNLDKAAKQLGGDYTTLDLGGAKIAYAIGDGEAKLEPFSVKLGSVPAKLKGSAKLEQRTMDFTITLKVPTKGLDGTILAGAKEVLGAKADVVVRAKGSFDDPKITVSLEGLDTEELVTGLVDAVLGEGASAEAKAQADKILADARKAADALIAEADVQAAAVEKAAKGNPLTEAAAAETAKGIRSEAKKAANKLLADAEKAAQAVLDGGKPGGGGGGGGGEGKTGKTGKAGKAGKAP